MGNFTIVFCLSVRQWNIHQVRVRSSLSSLWSSPTSVYCIRLVLLLLLGLLPHPHAAIAGDDLTFLMFQLEMHALLLIVSVHIKLSILRKQLKIKTRNQNASPSRQCRITCGTILTKFCVAKGFLIFPINPFKFNIIGVEIWA